MRELESTLGPNWLEVAIKELRWMLVSSLRSADYVGLPVADYFRNMASNPIYGHIGYAAATIHFFSTCFAHPKEKIVGTNVFQQISKKGLFFDTVARSAKKIITIGPWDLSDDISVALDHANVTHIEVQQHASFRTERSWGQYPHHHKVTERRIRDLGDCRHTLFLVAAGLLGKHYCSLVKQQGGVALDIGSVLDSWARKGRTDAIRMSETITLQKFLDKERLINVFGCADIAA